MTLYLIFICITFLCNCLQHLVVNPFCIIDKVNNSFGEFFAIAPNLQINQIVCQFKRRNIRKCHLWPFLVLWVTGKFEHELNVKLDSVLWELKVNLRSIEIVHKDFFKTTLQKASSESEDDDPSFNDTIL